VDTTALPASALKVRQAAERLGLAIAIREMPQSTRTAEEAAVACGCDVAQIVKSLVFAGPKGPDLTQLGHCVGSVSRAGVGRKRNDGFRTEVVESCPSLGMDSAGFFHPVWLNQIRP
jgi:hypothetical protein